MAEYLKLPDVARRLDVSEKTARRMVRSGKLPAVFIGGAYRVSEEDLAEYLKHARVKPGKAPRRSPSELTFNGLLAEERLLVYLRAVLEEIRGKASWAQSILEQTPDFAKPLVQGVSREATLNMWSSEIAALRDDVHVLGRIWGEVVDRVLGQSIPAEEQSLVKELRRELQDFDAAVEELNRRFNADFQRHRDEVKLLTNLHERRSSIQHGADAAPADSDRSSDAV